MPELPDVTVYCEAIAARVVGAPLVRVRLINPFLLRTAVPPIADAFGRRVVGVRRIGKRIVLALEGELFLVIHLMVAGRFRWTPPGEKIPANLGLGAFDFERGSLVLTEAGKKRRASLRVELGEASLAALDPGGLEPMTSTLEAFTAVLRRERHTLKRSLTDPHLFSGIGNAYSDEILHAAKLSPVRMSTALDDEEIARLHRATLTVLAEATDRLRRECGDGFPEKVTAFRPEMAAHGKYGKPCPVCGSKIARIVYAENETNYCPTCQTEGRLLADRSLSRLLASDWPKTQEALEESIAQKKKAISGPVR
jgi:formamidopyrimidine-DNA glycosylase